MGRLFFVQMLVCWFFLVAVYGEEEHYFLKVVPPKVVGKAVLVEMYFSKERKIPENGYYLQAAWRQRFVEKILSLPKEGAQFWRKYLAFEQFQSYAEGEKPERKEVKLQGEVILISPKGEFTYLEGGRVGSLASRLIWQQRGLERYLFWNKVFYPRESVRVGEMWKIPLASVAKVLRLPLQMVEEESSRARGVLKKVWKKGKSLWGRVEVEVLLKIRERGQMKGGKVKMKMVREGCVDGGEDWSRGKYELEVKVVRASGQRDLTMIQRNLARYSRRPMVEDSRKEGRKANGQKLRD
ncbi:MAG: hypothetical protein D6805_00480 [Planctomycetota bacterium]|nr:MAG: hypothetical protein D6805_00480 [Planctomycetota bacterium]